MEKDRLRGKTALVTGASSGLGADFARELAARGCHLVLVARREEMLRSLQRELTQERHIDVTVVPLDLTEEDAPQTLHDRLRSEGRTIDVLVNNAGYGIHGFFIEIPWERERNMLQLDIVVLTHLTKLFLPDMISRGFGYILQVSSLMAYSAIPTYASYAAAKSYVLMFGEALNYELRGTGVSCTVLSPGTTATEFLKTAGQQANVFQRLVMMQSPAVSRIGIKAMLGGRSSIVPGRINSLMAWSPRFAPRRLSTAVSHRLMALR